ncbi:MAG TPA: hypothetical protein VFW86_05145 [Candidatus Limnocylindrales bacterium]|nr:hypothetical protein [Candidatus Limnocylindrales bacterium]
MTMIPITPLPVRVRWDLFHDRPRSIRLAGEDLRVLEVERVRREAQAFPRTGGPLTTFRVLTPGGRLAITYEDRGGRWTVRGMDPGSVGE